MNLPNLKPEALKRELIARLDARTATVGVIGLGYVGLPLALRFAEVGYRVIGFDIEDRKSTRLNSSH